MKTTNAWVWSVAAACVMATTLGVGLAQRSADAGTCTLGDAKAEQKAPGDIIDVAVGPNMEEVTTLVAAVKAAGLVDTLKGKGPFTVFAPTNAAFAKLPKGTVETLLKPENKEALTKILTYHVVAGNNDAKAVIGSKSLKSVQGGTISIMEKDGKYYVGNEKGWAQIIKTDIQASNGTIHWIDAVIMPE